MTIVKANFTEEQGDFISSALDFAVHAHRDQRRKSGSPFIEHPIATAQYLAQLRMDPDTVAAGLLHDTMEDCDVEYKELVDHFNPSVATLVDSVTKLNADGSMLPWNPDGSAPITGGLDGSSEGEAALATARAASMRKMFVAMAKDVRVVVIKLADRLHNMLTLKALPYHRQIAIPRQKIAALANRADDIAGASLGQIPTQRQDRVFSPVQGWPNEVIHGRINHQKILCSRGFTGKNASEQNARFGDQIAPGLQHGGEAASPHAR